jgi:hypothetical protein
MKKSNKFINKKRLIAAAIFFAIAISLVLLPMISAYGEDEPSGYASAAVNIHGAASPKIPTADVLAAEASEKAADEAAQQEQAAPWSGTETRDVILWISLGLTVLVILLAAASIKRVEK